MSKSKLQKGDRVMLKVFTQVSGQRKPRLEYHPVIVQCLHHTARGNIRHYLVRGYLNPHVVSEKYLIHEDEVKLMQALKGLQS